MEPSGRTSSPAIDAQKLLWAAALTGIVLAGAGLRLAWGQDIEYKATKPGRSSRRSGPVPHNPSLGWNAVERSVAQSGYESLVFVFLNELSAPTILRSRRCVQVLNILAILLLISSRGRICQPASVRPGFWRPRSFRSTPWRPLSSQDLAASVLPIFVSALLIAWWRRQRWWGAFALGLIGAIIGQIHVAAFFLTRNLHLDALSTSDRRLERMIAGSVVARCHAPWLRYLSSELGGGTARRSISTMSSNASWITLDERAA